jgi:hypothetical protein
MNSTATDRSSIRQQLTQALGHEIDDTSWEVLEALPAEAVGPELIWRVEALRPQVPAQGTIYLHPIRPQAVDVAPPGTCSLCGDPLPAPGRFRCDSCAIAAQLVLGQPVQFIGTIAATAQSSSLTKGEEISGAAWIG